MKALLKTLAVIFYCFSVQQLTTADQFTMTPSSTDSMSYDSMNHDKPMDDTSTDSYWRQVRGDPFELTGQVRTYYIAAEEVIWDYAPDGYNRVNGSAFDETASEFLEARADRIGSKRIKCLYHEYSSSKFNQRRLRPAGDEYLGFLGPTVRAEVGDIIKIVFLNRCKFPASVHPHAVFYNKDSEGAPYNDGTRGADNLDDTVKTGQIHTYTWLVPERAGPGPMDGSSVMWMYHSHTDETKDFYAGLVGCMEVTRKGMGRADGSPKDVDREIFLMFSVCNENVSPYLNESFAKFSKSSKGTPPPPASDSGFKNANLMHAINGYMYGNGPLISVKEEEGVRWYLMSMGGVFDAHTPHWHGNTVLVSGMRMDVVSLLVAEMVVADMVPDNAGIWLFHCHVNDHMDDGMITRYEVKKDAKKG